MSNKLKNQEVIEEVVENEVAESKKSVKDSINELKDKIPTPVKKGAKIALGGIAIVGSVVLGYNLGKGSTSRSVDEDLKEDDFYGVDSTDYVPEELTEE